MGRSVSGPHSLATAVADVAKRGSDLAATVEAIANDPHRDPWLLLDGIKAAVADYNRDVLDITEKGMSA